MKKCVFSTFYDPRLYPRLCPRLYPRHTTFNPRHTTYRDTPKLRLISRIYDRQQTTGNATLLMTPCRQLTDLKTAASTDFHAFTHSANRNIYTMKYATLKIRVVEVYH